MANLFATSIGKKVIMSLSGLFLISFIIVHLCVNILLIFGDGTLFNKAAHFMDTNPVVSIVEPILGIGFLVHIIYSIIITTRNYFARPVKYKLSNPGANSTWASRNMFVLGGLILTFLIVHIANFFWKIKFGSVPYITINGEQVHDTYTLVSQLFINYWWYDLLYIAGAIFLGLHLSHGFWSGFQTIGLDNDKWKPRLSIAGTVFAVIIALGFSIIPLYFLIFFN